VIANDFRNRLTVPSIRNDCIRATHILHRFKEPFTNLISATANNYQYRDRVLRASSQLKPASFDGSVEVVEAIGRIDSNSRESV